MKREYLNARQQLEAGRLIDEHCHLVGEYAVYDAGWSDTRIAEQLKIRVDFIHNHRRKLVGNLLPVPPADKATMLEKIASQQAIIDALAQWAAERPVNPFRRPGQGVLDLKIVKAS